MNLIIPTYELIFFIRVETTLRWYWKLLIVTCERSLFLTGMCTCDIPLHRIARAD